METKKSKFSRRGFLIGAGILGAGAGALGITTATRKKGVSNAASSSGDADFVIIGAGHNSLACAMQLTRAGYKVLILEGSQRIGGAAKTLELTLPGFKHDVYATNIGMFLGALTFAEFKNDLFKNGFKPVVSEQPMASVFPDGTGMGMYKDAAKTQACLEKASPADAAAWVELFKYFQQTAPHFLPMLQVPMPSFAALRKAYSLVSALGVKGAYQFIRLLLQSPRQFVDYWFENPKTKALFIPWAMHLDFGPDVSGGAMFPFVEPPIYHSFGMPISQGGVGNLIEAMAAIVKQNGGEIFTGQKVAKVLTKNGQAVGVQTDDGKKIFTRKSVIANITPSQLICNMLDHGCLTSDYAVKCRKYRFGPGTMMIHMALDGPVEWAAGPEYGKFNYVHVGPYVEDLARTYTSAMNGCLPASPLLIVGQQSVTDPTRAPQGKQTLWVQVRLLPGKPLGDEMSGSGAIVPAPWPQIKEAYADRVMKKLEQYAPGISQKVLKRVVLSPADLEGENPNLVGGDSLGGSHHLDQFYMFRPLPNWSRYETPVKGLYLVGASTWPGAGLHGTSGHLLGKELLEIY